MASTGQAVSLSLLDDHERQCEGVRVLSLYTAILYLISSTNNDQSVLLSSTRLSSWWEIPLIDRINDNREDNNFAIIMDINPAPETMYRLGHLENTSATRIRGSDTKSGLQAMMFPIWIDRSAADAMYSLLRNGFGHNLFGREPGKIQIRQLDSIVRPRLDNGGNVLLDASG